MITNKLCLVDSRITNHNIFIGTTAIACKNTKGILKDVK